MKVGPSKGKISNFVSLGNFTTYLNLSSPTEKKYPSMELVGNTVRITCINKLKATFENNDHHILSVRYLLFRA